MRDFIQEAEKQLYVENHTARFILLVTSLIFFSIGFGVSILGAFYLDLPKAWQTLCQYFLFMSPIAIMTCIGGLLRIHLTKQRTADTWARIKEKTAAFDDDHNAAFSEM